MFVYHRNFLLICILAGFIAEVLLYTIYHNCFEHHTQAVLFFLSSLIVCAAGMPLAFRYRKPGQSLSGIYRYLPLVVVLIVYVMLYNEVTALIVTHPVQVSQSDIIPQTEVLVKRFVRGEYPYSPIYEWGWEMFPTYQPLQWLPYTAAELGSFDFRILAFVALLAAGIFPFVNRNLNFSWTTVAIPLALLLLVKMIASYGTTIFTVSLENLVASYYLFLAFALLTGSPVAIATGLACCLLSRYSVVLWIPLYLFMLLVMRQKLPFLKIIVIILGAVLLVYVIPFFIRDPSIFARGFEYHTGAALAEWRGQLWQPAGERPAQLFNGFGFAGAFYEMSGAPLHERLNTFRLLHFLVSATSVVALAVYFHKKRKKIKAPNVFALVSLKIYLLVFYSFIQIPYDYLFLPMVILSIPILFAALNSNKWPHNSFHV